LRVKNPRHVAGDFFCVGRLLKARDRHEYDREAAGLMSTASSKMRDFDGQSERRAWCRALMRIRAKNAKAEPHPPSQYIATKKRCLVKSMLTRALPV